MLPSCYILPLYYFHFGRRGIRVPSACSIGDPQVNVCIVLRLGRFFLREIARLSLRPCREGHRSFPFQRRQRHPVLFKFGVCWTGDRPPFFVQLNDEPCSFLRLFVCLFVCLYHLCVVTSIFGGLSWRRSGRPSERFIDRCVFGGPGAKPALRVTQFITLRTSVQVQHKM